MTHYPDILGYVTGGERVSLKAAQIALAVGPRSVRAGGLFQAFLLIQNIINTHVDIMASLNLPARDARKQTDRFTAPETRSNTRLRPGEVGCLLLPLRCAVNTASGTYKLGVTVTAQAVVEGSILRPYEQGPAPDLEQITPEHRSALEKLCKLNFSAATRGLGLRGIEVETPFGVTSEPAAEASPVRQSARFISLWTMAEEGTPQMLLAHYRKLVEQRLFPQINTAAIYQGLYEATLQRFEKAGYPLQAEEAAFITKMLALVVLMANPGDDQIDYLGSQQFNVAVLFKHPLPPDIHLPRWFDGLIRAIAYNEQIADDLIPVLCGTLYEALLRDTLPFAFAILSKTTGEDMGTGDEIRQYSDNYLKLLHERMDFGHTYLPLVLGGIIVFDRVIASGEVLEDTLRGMSDVLLARETEWTEDNDLVFLLAKELVNRSLRLFGYQI